MHTASIWSQAVDSEGRFAVTGSADRTVRIWSIADGKLLRTIWIPAGPDYVGSIYAVAINPDGSTIAAGGWTENISGRYHPIYLFDRETGTLIKRIHEDLLGNNTYFLTFSPDGRYLAATVGGGGLRVFDRDKDWSETFRDDSYGDRSEGASFSADGRLATTSWDGKIRLYQFDPKSDSPKFRAVGQPVKTPSGNRPYRITFSPDGKRLAVGYIDVAAVDVLDGTTLTRLGGQSPADVRPSPDGLDVVTWSRDGQTLFSVGGVLDAEGRVFLFSWDRGGLGTERRLSYCANDTAVNANALPEGRVLVASLTTPCLRLIDARGESIWTVPLPILDFRDQPDTLNISQDGKIVDFGFRGSAGGALRFDAQTLTLSSAPPSVDATFAPNREGLAIDGWRNGSGPTLGGQAIPLSRYDRARSLAVAPDAKRFFLGSSFALTAFDHTGKEKWRRPSRGEAWAVNASKDGRLVIAAHGDGAIRWHRADDGSELLALQVLPNKKDWVLWTPEGFYEATPGARDVLKWVTTHGPDSAATTLSVSAIPELHRPDALKLVLDQLETPRALGIADVAAARVKVQTATGSLAPPGAVLHVLAVGIDRFGDKAGALHLDYAVDDAHDVASVLLGQKSTPEKPSLYVDVKPILLRDQTAGRKAILDAMDDMARTMQAGPVQDVAVILISTHGALIKDDDFYLVPYGFDVATQRAMQTTGVSLTEFAKAVTAIAEKGKVLLLLDACHSGAVGLGA
jgi:WD40 repeat protein